MCTVASASPLNPIGRLDYAHKHPLMWEIVPQQKPVRKILSAWTNEILKNVVQMDGVIIQKLEQDGRGIRLTVGPIDPKLAKP